MPEPRPRLNLERWVHWTLLSGLAVSASLLIAGLAALMHQGPSHTPPPPTHLPAVLRAARAGQADALIDLGLLALIATPILRVGALVVGWSLARDWQFAAVALAVLSLLGLSLALGLG